MTDDRIKSALEIAMEKAQGLGALSDEEKVRLRSGELDSAAEALAQRYLNGAPLSEIETDLAKRGEQELPAVRDRLLRRLLDAIELSPDSGNDRVLTAVEHISGDPGPAQAIRSLLQEHDQALESHRLENAGALEEAKRRELEGKGISGSAVEPAIETSPDRVQARQSLDSGFEQRLQDIKRQLQEPG